MVYFVSGIDTDVGKSVATGFLARRFAAEGKRVITQKLVQTGCQKMAEDIITHRKIMGINLLPEDVSGVTCAYVFKYPASPHLSARMENTEIDPAKIAAKTELLRSRYDVVLLEGAGGLAVPLSQNFTTLDYICKHSLPLYLVVSSKLGSLNHALLSLEACLRRNIFIAGIVYNTYPAAPQPIERSTADYIRAYLAKHSPETQFIEMARIDYGK